MLRARSLMVSTSILFAGTLFTAGCTDHSFDKPVTRFLKSNDTTFAQLRSLEIEESMDSIQGSDFFAERLGKEKQRIFRLLSDMAKEPCINQTYTGKQESYELDDLVSLQQNYDRGQLSDNSSARGCFFILKEKQDMLSAISERVKGGKAFSMDPLSIQYLHYANVLQYFEGLMRSGATFRSIHVSYKDLMGNSKQTTLIMQTSPADTLVYRSRASIRQFLWPVDLPVTKVDAILPNEVDLAPADSVTWVSNYYSIVNEDGDPVHYALQENNGFFPTGGYSPALYTDRGLAVTVDTTKLYRFKNTAAPDRPDSVNFYAFSLHNILHKNLLLYDFVYIQQAQDPKGVWRSIEFGSPMYIEGPTLRQVGPQDRVVGFIRRYNGTVKTRMRIKFRTQRIFDRPYGAESYNYLYSEPYDGWINPSQFYFRSEQVISKYAIF